jgi:aspartyl-tRNA(Asn)/glutamyl-tRNA(Gln) amidotransferase subunit C
MDVDEDLVRHVAKIARLKLGDEEVSTFVPMIKEVLDMFSEIDECDVTDISPSFQPLSQEGKLREDVEESCISPESALSLTENKKDGYFKGPKII